MLNPDSTRWLRFAPQIREPVQFIAWGFGLLVAVLLAAIFNADSLDRAGLIWLFGIIAIVLLRLVSLGALIVARQPIGTRRDRKRQKSR
jgi:hypothetical protein